MFILILFILILKDVAITNLINVAKSHLFILILRTHNTITAVNKIHKIVVLQVHMTIKIILITFIVAILSLIDVNL
jgi:hypothetical protein